KEAIRSVLRVSEIESAIFFTDSLSTKSLKIKDKLGPRDLGSIAGSIEALTPLPPTGAVLIVGINSYPLVSEPNVTYDITIKQVCSTENACSKADITSVYKGLFTTGTAGEEIDIIGVEHREHDESTPEIGCVGLNFSANNEIPPAG